MATLVLGAAGAAIGGSLGGSMLGLGAAALGRAAGATAGRLLDQRILGGGADAVDHGRVDRFRLTGAAEGAAIPRVTGRMRVGGQVIWASRFKEHRTESGGGGKGAPSGPRTRSYSYSASFALALCEGEIARVGRVWADGEEIARDLVPLRVHPGTEDQLPDALIEAVEGEGRAPAFRGTAYVVIEDLDLTRFGNRVPQLSFEVVRPVRLDGGTPPAGDLIRGVALVPGTGEYALATTMVHYDHGEGEKDAANVNTVQILSDFDVSLRDLTEELPNVGAASLVVSWFGDDLRCGRCSLRPLVEQTEFDGRPMPWTVSGLDRAGAGLVPTVAGKPVYGGTPADASVVESIRAMNARGLEVTFYPFVLMSQLEGNGLPDPSGGAEQPALPWRGRITTEKAPGVPGTTDRSAAARAEVDAFFGSVRASDYAVGNGTVSYSGPDEWSYGRFILHYAALCAAAGGVEGFCIGSELRSLTRIRAEGDAFPAVERLVDLLEEVRTLLPDAALGYAADWSEYFGYHPGDTGNVHFHLDAVWGHADCDFVGIDNYMPLTDWRDGTEHVDAAFGSILNPDYLAAGIAGGEGFDWYYPDEAARDGQMRAPIQDGAHGEPWVFRYKDLQGWWANPHHDRIGGQRAANPTAWVPRSKPFRFVEYGCAALDKGTNQPNKFLDPKSSESRLPHYSNGRRDDAMQEAYLTAFLDHWSRDVNNPASPAYGGAMVDMSHSFAWAWDARPWPAFPALEQFWTDGPNHARGHWIGGRSGNQRLRDVVAEICLRGGLDDVDVEGVHGVVRGHLVRDVQTARADLQSLLVAYGVEGSEAAGRVRFSMRSLAPTRPLQSDSLVWEDDAPVSFARSAGAETPGRVRVSHVDAAGRFEGRVADAVDPGGAILPVDESEVPLSLTGAEGHALAQRYLAESRVSRDTLTCRLPPSRRDVAVGDLIRLDGSADTWRVDRIVDEGVRRVSARRAELATLEAGDVPEESSRAVRPRAPMPVEVHFLDLPLLTGKESPHAPHVAVSARPWPGSVEILSAVEDADYRWNVSLDGPALIGTTLTELPAAAPGRWDNGPELVLRLPGAALQDVTVGRLLSGANALALGPGGTDGWEVVQFQKARLVGPEVWALSRRLRGLRGTDGLLPRDLPVGSRVVVLDRSLRQVDLPVEAVGLPRDYRIGPAGLPLDHPSFRHRRVTGGGVGLLPFAPTHLRAVRSGGDINLSWVRRTRVNGDRWGAGDVALGEAFERYRVEVVRDGAIVGALSCDVPHATLDAGMLASLGLTAGGFSVRVAQVSDAIGPGYRAEVGVI